MNPIILTILFYVLAGGEYVVPANTDYRGLFGWCCAVDELQSTNPPQPPPIPTPEPQPLKLALGSDCPKCEGGKVDGDGDGSYDIDCLACRGDGRCDKGDPILSIGTETREAFKESRSVLKRFSELSQFVRYNNMDYYWNPNTKLFIASNGRTITPPQTFDISRDDRFKVCTPKFCTLVFVQKKSMK